MREIPLRGKYRDLVVVIDDEDYERVAQHRWLFGRVSASKDIVYARRMWREDGRWRQQYLHAFLTGWPLVDHINHNGLDNRRENLRAATHAENMRHARKRRTHKGVPCSSLFKGVARSKTRWQAQITVDKRGINLGRYVEEVDAARAYDLAALQYFGEFAVLNFPEEHR